MNKIEHRGNLPSSLQVLAGTMDQGKEYGAEFWECTNAEEIMKLARERKCELNCNMDPMTKRGFIVGCEVKDADSKIILPGRETNYTMLVYFTEVTHSDFKRYDKLLKKHRKQQQQAMYTRRGNNAKQSPHS